MLLKLSICILAVQTANAGESECILSVKKLVKTSGTNAFGTTFAVRWTGKEGCSFVREFLNRFVQGKCLGPAKTVHPSGVFA